jgi:hypothetical protein
MPWDPCWCDDWLAHVKPLQSDGVGRNRQTTGARLPFDVPAAMRDENRGRGIHEAERFIQMTGHLDLAWVWRRGDPRHSHCKGSDCEFVASFAQTTRGGGRAAPPAEKGGFNSSVSKRLEQASMASSFQAL